jgi:hypothetical protein
MAIRRVGIPSTPQGFPQEQHQFFQALKQEVERLDKQVAALQTALADTLKQGATYTTDLGIMTGGVLTPDPRKGMSQFVVNNGAFTLAPPADDGFINLWIYEGGSAGAITTPYDEVTGSYALHAANTVYMARLTRVRGVSHVQYLRLT